MHTRRPSGREAVRGLPNRTAEKCVLASSYGDLVACMVVCGFGLLSRAVSCTEPCAHHAMDLSSEPRSLMHVKNSNYRLWRAIRYTLLTRQVDHTRIVSRLVSVEHDVYCRNATDKVICRNATQQQLQFSNAALAYQLTPPPPLFHRRRFSLLP